MKTKIFPLLLFSLLFVAESLSMPGKQKWMSNCQVKFSIRNTGLEVEGSIEEVASEIMFDPDHLTQSYIRATANPSTIHTGIKIRDTHLKRNDYFNVASYPEIRLQSKSFRRTGKHTFTGRFDLTIKNTTREMAIPFTCTQESGTIAYKGSFEINRLDFGLGEKSTLLDEKVRIVVSAKAQ